MTASPMYNKQPDLSNDTEKIMEISPNGRYAKLNCVLGKGAYKIVYKAIDREEGYEVAWNSCQTTKAEYMEISEEIEILKRVRHPNIIQFHDCWLNGQEFIFVTELMTSGTLREYIKKLQIPNLKIVKRWARQILKGLAYLHSMNPPIIHRDLKCDNIFINGAHGEVKIGDMGTAKMKMGKKYTLIGTPEFMAPEMYEERGYSEKVDIYAFGMALLEMVTGEYPYSECKNAAQIYKKVTQGIKPECLSRIKDPEVLDLINNCIGAEHERLTAPQLLEHPFLAVEPEVILLQSNNDLKNYLQMQVVFKGMDKLSVKFDFNVDTDTAAEVVKEMIDEQVLPERYQHLITTEINRILREINKYTPETDENREENRTIWRRHEYENIQYVERQQIGTGIHSPTSDSAEHAGNWELKPPVVPQGQQQTQTGQQSTPAIPTTSSSIPVTSNASPPRTVPSQSPAQPPPPQQQQPTTTSTTTSTPTSPPPQQPPASQGQPLQPTDTMTKDVKMDVDTEESLVTFGTEYEDESPIEDLVRDTAAATNRGVDKANEWISRLKAQDIMTVGDLRDLTEEDWSNLGLTVFASRALKNALLGKLGVSRNVSPRNLTLSRTGSGSGGSTVTTGFSRQASQQEDYGYSISQASLGGVNEISSTSPVAAINPSQAVINRNVQQQKQSNDTTQPSSQPQHKRNQSHDASSAESTGGNNHGNSVGSVEG